MFMKTLGLVASSLSLAVLGNEPINFIYTDSALVFEMPDGYTYHHANLWCEKQGFGGLITIHTVEDNAMIQSALRDMGLESAWIGLYSDGVEWHNEGDFYINFERWAVGQGEFGEPDTARAVIKPDGLWYNQDRAEEITGIVCSGSSVAVHVSAWELLSWKDANDKCKEEYGPRSGLATIHTKYTSDLIERVMHNWTDNPISTAWIGFKDDEDEGKWYWRDGSPDRYTNWGTGYPRESYTDNCAAVTSRDDWRDDDCSRETEFACTTPVSHADSVVNWNYRVAAYYGHANESADYCMRFNSHLATITNAEQNRRISEMARGLLLDRVWIGYYAEDGQVWQWRDGSPTDYENWGHGQPVEHQFAQMVTATGHWENVAGSENVNERIGVVCMRGAIGEYTPGQGRPRPPMQMKEDAFASVVAPENYYYHVTGGVFVAVAFAALYYSFYRVGGAKKLKAAVANQYSNI